ncbi:hypothetical protein P154DRAFT_475798 [Amniculicola lignicola CBS 123094]|uniref:EF1G-domain-containing protein n=1 Tax=Amniculicola lignicola CBS 123094 TaxID=1392246 RepID=A0A6A5VYQ5_9PLEO|nr:hypothetical protein P154DRAFT_475798 [Amniculicola lignicola CBS 123094]
MSFGKIYSYPGNPRTTSLLAIAKENGLDVEFVHTEPAKGVSAEYLKINKLGKVPTFEGADGFVVSEAIAIAIYLTSQNEKTTLLGKTKQDYASILRWMSYANNEVLSPLGGWFRPILGRDPYNKKNVDESQKATTKAVHVFEEHLLTHTYLVGERLTLADIFAASVLARGFQYFYDDAWRAENPNVTRWYETIYNVPSYSAVAGKLEFIKEAIKNVAPKKEAAPKQEKPKKAEAPKPKKEVEEDEEEEDKPAPKPKHPLEALPRATFVLDDWKRKYSNEETRGVALPWFWENAKFDEYSIWRVDYKYNDELTMTFMTSNLIGGFFARLEGSRKYIFGAASVYGKTNDSIIQGAFFIRGQEALPAFDVAPDYESYEFTKLDPTKAEDKEFVNDQWAWDKPITVDGKEYEWADGKGAGGGPSEDNVTGFLVRSTAAKWAKNSVLAVDAGSHLAAITRILESDFPLVSALKEPQASRPRLERSRERESASPTNPDAQLSGEESSNIGTPGTEEEEPPTITTLEVGPFAGLPFPNQSARANALHVVREHVSTYLITHPHLDHVSGFVINTAAFHNTSRPKRLAALPFTVNAIKTHIFNNIVWPNLTDEDGGVGLVTFQRLAEGGNIALGEGSGRGYIEVCDSLAVKGFKVSHGHCMKGPGHVHRGSNANLPETPGIQHHSSHHPDSGTAEGREGRSLSFSFPTQSAPGTPLFPANRADGGRTASIGGNNVSDQCVIDSSVYFIRTDATPHSPCREVLIFGDVEPDSVSLSPRTAHIWAEAAPKIAAGILTGVFIECSYNNSQGDAVLYGHLAPRHLITELQNLGEMVKEARREHEREKEEQRKGRKRKRASHGLFPSGPEAETSARKGSKSRSMAIPKEVQTDDEVMTDYATSTPGRMTGTQTPTMVHPAAPPALNLAHMSAEHGRALQSATFDSPLKGLKVVIIHVKDTLSDGPLVGESILEELQEAERALQEQGKGLGCTFVISKSGGSYHF